MVDEGSGGFVGTSVPVGYERFMLHQLFEPWAEVLVERAGLRRGASVLDVASGLGPVARVASRVVGPSGVVVSSDSSGSMLALAASASQPPGSASIRFLGCSASAIATTDGSFDAVLCQQGLQFFTEQELAAREMHRVLRPGGAALIAIWAAEHPLGLFGPMVGALRDAGMNEPSPRAFDPGRYVLGASELAEMFSAAGFSDVQVETVLLDATWANVEELTRTVLGSPFGPLVSGLDSAMQSAVRGHLLERFGTSGDGTVTVHTATNIARCTK